MQCLSHEANICNCINLSKLSYTKNAQTEKGHNNRMRTYLVNGSNCQLVVGSSDKDE